MELRIVREGDIEKGARVIVRADFDVPMRGRRVQDDTRIRAHEPTLRFLLKLGARIRIIAHRGRPDGTRDPALTIASVPRLLSRILKRRVSFVNDPFSPAAYEKFNSGEELLLFENLRFWPGEEKNSATFARSLARWGDAYVNEAFAACHRAHASLIGLPRLLPSFAGLHLAEEIAALERVMKNPARPFVAVLGGAKMETKMPLIRRLLRDADRILVGGALANAFFAAAGKNIGRSFPKKGVRIALSLLKSKKLVLPSDVVAADGLEAGAARRVRSADGVGVEEYIADIGPASRKSFAGIIREAGTIVWNGPMGYVEVRAFAQGTQAIADAMVKSKGFSVVGGGDTVAALARSRRVKGFGHLSTGGGAMLEFLSGKKLPGIEPLMA